MCDSLFRGGIAGAARRRGQRKVLMQGCSSKRLGPSVRGLLRGSGCTAFVHQHRHGLQAVYLTRSHAPVHLVSCRAPQQHAPAPGPATSCPPPPPPLTLPPPRPASMCGHHHQLIISPLRSQHCCHLAPPPSLHTHPYPHPLPHTHTRTPAGTPAELEAEVARLQGRLQKFERRLAELGPIPTRVPYLASVLSSLHAKRSKSLRAEIGRLLGELAGEPKAEL